MSKAFLETHRWPPCADDVPAEPPASGHARRGIDADLLARCWNDAQSEYANLDAIGWWLDRVSGRPRTTGGA